MVVVQQPEIVDIDEGDTERQTGHPGALDLLGKVADEGPVIQRSRQGIPTDRLDQGDRLSRQPPLRRAEDQKEERSGNESGAERHDDHVAADIAQPLEDREGIPPDSDDGANLAAAADRQILADQPIRTSDGRSGTRLGGGDDRGLGGSGHGKVEGFVSRRHSARGGRCVCREDPAVKSTHLDAKDFARRGQGPELLVEDRELGRRWAGPRVGEIPAVEMGVDERPDRRRVAADDVVQCCRGEVRGNHRRLRRRRDPDEGEKGAIDQQQEDGAADSRL